MTDDTDSPPAAWLAAFPTQAEAETWRDSFSEGNPIRDAPIISLSRGTR